MKKYDVMLFKNHVYIGMEDVSTTYRQAEKKTCLTAEEAKEVLMQTCKSWENDETVIKERERAAAGHRSYYPSEYETPCMAIIAESGVLDDCYISNYNDIIKVRSKGAQDFFFSKGSEAIENIFN